MRMIFLLSPSALVNSPQPSPRMGLLPAFRILLICLLVLDVLWWYWADRRLRCLPGARWWRGLLGLFVATMIATMVVPIAWPRVGHGPDGIMPIPLRMAQHLWHLIIVLPFIIGLMIVGLLGRFWRGIRWICTRGKARPHAETADLPTPLPMQPLAVRLTRRQLLGATAVMLLPLVLGTAVGASLWQLGRFRIRRLRVPVPNLPDALHGMSIAHVTDIHVGRFLQLDDLATITDATNALNADLVILTGDLIDSGLGDLPALTVAVKKMRPGVPGGLAMCLGNHDLMGDGRRFVREVKASGIPLLVDEARSVCVRETDIQLLGLNWYRSDTDIRAGVQRMLSHFSLGDGFPILL